MGGAADKINYITERDEYKENFRRWHAKRMTQRYKLERTIAAVMEARGLTVEEVSKGSGVTQFRIQWGIIERRKGWRPKPEDFEKICAFLQLDLMEMKSAGNTAEG